MTAEFLASRYRVIRNRGNFNNHIGLPLSLIDLRQRPEIAVVELGMNHTGEISTLVGLAEPDVRVWTNVGEAHLGFFASVDAIADAKAEIFEARDAGDRARRQRRRRADRGAAAALRRTRGDLRHRARRRRSRDRRRRSRDRRHNRARLGPTRRDRPEHAARRPRQPGEPARGDGRRARVRRAARRDRRTRGDAPAGQPPRRGRPSRARR